MTTETVPRMSIRSTQRDAYHWPLGGEPVFACRDLHQPNHQCSESGPDPGCLPDSVKFGLRGQSLLFAGRPGLGLCTACRFKDNVIRSEEHTSELQSPCNL